MYEDSTFSHSRSVEAPDLRGTGAHHLSGAGIRAAETVQMLSSHKVVGQLRNIGSQDGVRTSPAYSHYFFARTAAIIPERPLTPSFLVRSFI